MVFNFKRAQTCLDNFSFNVPFHALIFRCNYFKLKLHSFNSKPGLVLGKAPLKPNWVLVMAPKVYYHLQNLTDFFPVKPISNRNRQQN